MAEAGAGVERGADLGPAHVAVRPDDAQAELLDGGLAAGAVLGEQALDVFGVARIDERPHRAADDLALGALEQRQPGAVHAPDRAVERGDDESVAGKLEEALLKRFVGNVAEVVHLCPLPGVPHCKTRPAAGTTEGTYRHFRATRHEARRAFGAATNGRSRRAERSGSGMRRTAR